MMLMRTGFIIYVIFISFEITRERYSANGFHLPDNYRSGGYPKFSDNETTEESDGNLVDQLVGNESMDSEFQLKFNPNECGTRSVGYLPQRNARIVGGAAAPYGAFPWQVEIKIFHYDKMTFEHHCGGAVIAERLVLSAAHCLQIQQVQLLRVVTGKHQLKDRDLHEHSFRVDTILTHPEFRKRGPYSNDIAIIKIKTHSVSGIGFNTHIRPICLPEVNQTPPPGTWCTVTGWGAQKAEDLKSIPSVLQAAAVPLLDLKTCRKENVNGGRQQEVLDTMLCAGFLKGGVDACGGDSGGPLACEINNRFVLTGLVSWGDGCAKKNRPGVYTRVDAFTTWIQQSIIQLDNELD